MTTIKDLAAVRDCSNVTQCGEFTRLARGTVVQMQCYKLDSNAPGDGYIDNKWFLITADLGGANGPVTGFVQSSYVSWPQPVVPSCDSVASERAVRWALDRMSWPNWDPDRCLQFMDDAYRYGARSSVGIGDPHGDITAWYWWNQYPASQARTWKPPRGALVFFGPSIGHSGAGHVALSLGGGRAVSSYDGKESKVHVLNIGEFPSYVGYIWPNV